ncbi:hypothetical protein C8J56DRAFT_763945, partial [Mycena floridula]
ASPDHTLATHAMTGKKRDKFHITLLFTANADGTEKLPISFIAKSKIQCENQKILLLLHNF